MTATGGGKIERENLVGQCGEPHSNRSTAQKCIGKLLAAAMARFSGDDKVLSV